MPTAVTWLQVRLPGRPNGLTGWIAQRATTRSTTAWHLVVDRAARRVTVYRAGRVVRIFPAVVGRPTAPTPRGEFFVEEIVQLPSSAPGAPFALALSARSDVYREFDGGPGQIAFHGVANLGGTLGTAVSHGCVRLSTAAITWLAWHLRTGVPVTRDLRSLIRLEGEAMSSAEPPPLRRPMSKPPESHRERLFRHGRRARLYASAVLVVGLLAVLVILISRNNRSRSSTGCSARRTRRSCGSSSPPP